MMLLFFLDEFMMLLLKYPTFWEHWSFDVTLELPCQRVSIGFAPFKFKICTDLSRHFDENVRCLEAIYAQEKI
ncbi:hypothetical protein RJT34_16187 [Clitoria ternatea]|uniref:Uncharacterized protein n=1 Tax=Clitoria ternatea TaxID=43366 RepID=A0AAN9J7W6_CLITE